MTQEQRRALNVELYGTEKGEECMLPTKNIVERKLIKTLQYHMSVTGPFVITLKIRSLTGSQPIRRRLWPGDPGIIDILVSSGVWSITRTIRGLKS